MLWGNQCLVSGSLTVLFDRGGAGQTVYNAFDLEQDLTLVVKLDSADGTDFVEFVFPRVKINAGSIGDAVAEGLPVETEFRALKPQASVNSNVLSDEGFPLSQVLIQDSTVTP